MLHAGFRTYLGTYCHPGPVKTKLALSPAVPCPALPCPALCAVYPIDAFLTY